MQSVTSSAVSKAISFSETEQLTGGTWIDGSPLYRKVLVAQISQNGSYTIPLGLTRAKVRNWRGNFFQKTVDNPDFVMHIPYTYFDPTNTSTMINIYVYFNPSTNSFECDFYGSGQYAGEYFNGYAVLFVEYTKN